jgi:hypothetical protein
MDKDAEGWADFKEFLLRASEDNHCTVLTIRSYVNKYPDLFEHRHSQIRAKKISPLPDQVKQNEEFNKWQEQREAILNECLEFLKVQTPTPYIENILVQIASVREELRSYTDTKLSSLIMDLQREFNFTPKNLPEISEVTPSA